MKVFVTGVGGQLGHDVMNELAKRGYEGIGSDIALEYSGAQDESASAEGYTLKDGAPLNLNLKDQKWNEFHEIVNQK